MVRARWFHSVGGFNPKIYLNWGHDLELSYRARKTGGRLFIHDDLLVDKAHDQGYSSGRYGMSVQESEKLAMAEMHRVYCELYG